MNEDTGIRLRICDSAGKWHITLDGSGPWVIGRDAACEVVISDDRASRRHAVLRRSSRGLVVEDLGSSNGTRIDGRAIEGTAPFPGGSQLQFGEATVARRSGTRGAGAS
jgi:pSer/pThr/pTyr-binding forkhead associated (FHA) protein